MKSLLGVMRNDIDYSDIIVVFKVFLGHSNLNILFLS